MKVGENLIKAVLFDLDGTLLDVDMDNFLQQLVTYYEVMHYCKPLSQYYLEIAEFLGVKPEECLMIGNDLDDDIAAAAATGMKTFLVTDHIVHKSGQDVSPDDSGTTEEVLRFWLN